MALVLCGCSDKLPQAPPDPPPSVPARVLYTTSGPGGASIMVADADGSNRQAIARGALAARASSGRIAYSRGDSLFVATLANGVWGERLITVLTEEGHYFDRMTIAISPDGRLVTFTTTYNDFLNPMVRRTYLTLADGSSGLGAPFLVPVAYETTPVFSPDSRSLAFYASDDPTTFGSSGQVYVASTDGLTALKPVAPVAEVGNDASMWLDWSPDNKKIVYYSIASGDYGSIYTVGADGAGRKNIAAGGYPVWSPDGKKIAYISGANVDILMINADGSGAPENITNTPGSMELYPQWSPDGRQILYVSYLGDPEHGPGTARVISVANTSDVKNASETGEIFKAYWLP